VTKIKNQPKPIVEANYALGTKQPAPVELQATKSKGWLAQTGGPVGNAAGSRANVSRIALNTRQAEGMYRRPSASELSAAVSATKSALKNAGIKGGYVENLGGNTGVKVVVASESDQRKAFKLIGGTTAVSIAAVAAENFYNKDGMHFSIRVREPSQDPDIYANPT
jgi:hypothetical protein